MPQGNQCAYTYGRTGRDCCCCSWKMHFPESQAREKERGPGQKMMTRPKNFLRSSRNRADLLSYESKTTGKRQQNNWMGGKNLDGDGGIKSNYQLVVPTSAAYIRTSILGRSILSASLGTSRRNSFITTCPYSYRHFSSSLAIYGTEANNKKYSFFIIECRLYHIAVYSHYRELFSVPSIL